ncbi:MAG: hypothetical protein J5I90_00220 [Caldilineales bacterium]|nr:hypothetical protein [Caldilineales bacterium]
MTSPTDSKPPSPDSEIDRLETEIAELKSQFPKHSLPPALLLRLEELEDELKTLLAQQTATNED